MCIFDIGKVGIKRYCELIEKSKTIVWNGPLGVYEFNRFSHASKRIAEAVARATKKGAISIIGGGDTIDFHLRYKYSLKNYTFVSMGGGAMLEFIGGKKYPNHQCYHPCSGNRALQFRLPSGSNGWGLGQPGGYYHHRYLFRWGK